MSVAKYYISESFDSIQGEGNYAGALSFFLRFQYCNLTCSWCDSKFTWGKKDGIQAVSVDEVKAMIQASASLNVILTGGEPTLYALDKLVVEGKKLHVETNGTIIPTEPLNIQLPDGTHFERKAMDEAVVSRFNWVVSPKMCNAKQKLNDEAMRYWAGKSWCVFKFIVQNEEDIAEVGVVVNHYGIDKTKVYLGLEGNTLESQIKPKLVDAIMAAGYNFSPRLHVLLWGNERKK